MSHVAHPQSKACRVLAALERCYGRPRWRRFGDPVSILVGTILSQNTNDANSSAGYRQLRRAFRTWDAVAQAPVDEIERAIRVSGLGHIKAGRIQDILRQIRRERGSLNLDFLARLDWPEAYAWLRRFKGIGPKTALCVLLFSLHQPVFPVDTHIDRIARRLGLLAESVPAAKAHEVLAPLIPPADRFAMHILMIQHGRGTCRAANPRCDWCDLRRLCPHGKGALRNGPGDSRVRSLV